MDYDAILHAPIYTALGVDAVLTPNRPAPEEVAVRALDKTDGVEVPGSIEIETVRPAAMLRARQLVGAGVAFAELDGGTIALGGRTWLIDMHQVRPSPGGEDSGEVMLFLIEETNG